MGAPKAPDPMKTAQAQGQMNKETAITQSLLGMTNQVTPFGSLTWNQIGNWSGSQPQQSASAPVQPQTSQPTTTRKDHRNNYPVWTQKTTTRGGGQSGGSSVSTTSANGGLYDVPRFEAVQTLSPQLQGTVDNFLGTANTLSGQLKDSLSKPIDLSGLPGRVNSLSLRDVGTNLGLATSFGGNNPIQMGLGPQDWSEDRQRVEDALMSRLNPQLERDRANREADMRARGIAPGSGQAYNNGVDELNRQSNDARMAAILAGGQEQSRLFGLDLAQGQFANSAQQQAYQQALERATFGNTATAANAEWERSGIGINNQNALTRANFQNQARSAGLEELFALRQSPINEISSLLSGTQIAGPKFTQTPQPGVNGVDYTGLVNQQYQSQMQGYQGMLGGLGGIGSALIGALPFSDRRLKRNIRKVGRWHNGLNVYSYDKFGRQEIGFMADEVKRVRPFAVKRHHSGYDVVDYAEAIN